MDKVATLIAKTVVDTHIMLVKTILETVVLATPTGTVRAALNKARSHLLQFEESWEEYKGMQ